MKKPQKLLYLEHYPHFLAGVKNSTLHLTREKLRELNTLPDNKRDAKVENMPGIDNTFAFYELLRTEDVSDVLKEVGKRGFWVGLWEEGSYTICKPEYKQKCIDKIVLQEARINKGDFRFE